MSELPWPAGWPRTPAQKRRRGNFKRKEGPNATRSYSTMRPVTVAEAWRDVTFEVGRFDATDLRVDFNGKANRDGTPSADRRQRDDDTDPGAVVHFRLKGRPLVIACDAFTDLAANLRAIALCIESKRRLLAYGFLDMEREFEGYAALPETAGAMPPLHVILEVAETAGPDVVKAAWRAWTLKNHPDRGGDSDLFARVSAAYQAQVQA